MNNIVNQYKSPDNLNKRISIHDIYSTNRQPFGDWIVSHYDIRPGTRILELGCGTGSMWMNHLGLLSGADLVLTDFSEGMLETARRNVKSPNVTFQQVDIQSIPHPNDSFDTVIANMMLYHVPDLHLGLSEVRRVLKPGGIFYCATFGIHGILEYINELLRDTGVNGSIGTSFTLQNGADILSRHFDRVQRLDREDGLAVTVLSDFADYVYSLSGLTNIHDLSREVLMSRLAEKVENGILYVPKEYGMFICT